MKKVDFLLYYEHWQRELFGLSLLKYELEKEGYTVALSAAPIYKSEDYVGYFLDPEVIVYPWYYRDRNVISAHAFSDKPKKIINMQAEQILSEWSLGSGFYYTKKEAHSAFHVAWTEEQRERFIQSGIKEKNIISSGSINYDVNNKVFDIMYKSKEELAKESDIDSSKEWIVYFASFTYIARSNEEMDELETKLPGAYELKRIYEDVKEQTIEWIKKYLINNPNKIIIYKPHPDEIYDIKLEKLSKKLSNFKYISRYTIHEWINVCEKVITWNSTSVVEALLKDKKSALVRPNKVSEKYLINLPNEIFSAESYQGFEAFLNDKLDSFNINYQAKNGKLKNTFFNEKNQFSVKKLAKEAIKIFEQQEFPKCDTSLCGSYKNHNTEYEMNQHFFNYSKLVHEYLKKKTPIEEVPTQVQKSVSMKRKEDEIYNKIKNVLDGQEH